MRTATTTTINRPVPFVGTPAQRAANYASHQFVWDGEEVRCYDCDHRPTAIAASYACGTRPPREIVVIPR